MASLGSLFQVAIALGEKECWYDKVLSHGRQKTDLSEEQVL